MSVSSTLSKIQYVGNGSTVITYVIPFPFLSIGDIFAQVSVDGVSAEVVLAPGTYTVTRLADGSGGTLRTSVAVPAIGTITIFRATALTQPTTFQLAGPFPSKTAETALDRLAMQVQELSRQVAYLEAGVDFSGPGEIQSFAVVPIGVVVPLASNMRVCILPAPMSIRSVMIAAGAAGGVDMPWTLKNGATTIAASTLPAGAIAMTIDAATLATVPEYAQLMFATTVNSGVTGLVVTLFGTWNPA